MAELKVVSQPANVPTLNLARPQAQPTITNVARPAGQPTLSVPKTLPQQPQIVSIGDAQTQVPTQQRLSTAQFAQTIKAKYPQYANIDDAELTKRILEKYPQYQGKVDFSMPEAPTQPVDRSKGFFGRLFDDLKGRVENLKKSSQLVDEGKQGNVGFGFQTLGQIAGGVGDVIGEGLTSTFRTLAPQSAQEGLQTLGDNIGQSKVVQDLAQKYQGFKEAHPVGAANLEAAGNIAQFLPIGKGAGLVGRGVTGAVEKVAPGLIERTGQLITNQLEKRALSAAEKEALTITKPILNVAEKKAAIAGERATQSITGNITIAPSRFDENVARAVTGIVKKSATIPENVAAVKSEIGNIARGVEQELKTNNAIFNKNQLKTALDAAKEESRVIFGTDKTLESNYDAVVNELMRQVDKGPKNLDGLWKARQAFDDVVESKFGKKVFGDATDNVRRNAIQDVRRAVNEYVANRLPEGNQYKEALKRMTNMYEAVNRMAAQGVSYVDQSWFKTGISAIREHPAYAALTLGLTGSVLGSIFSHPTALLALLGGSIIYAGGKKITPKLFRAALQATLEQSGRAMQVTEREAIKRMIQNINVSADPESEQ